MMNYVWSGMVLLSVICAFISEKTADLTSAIIEAGNQAVGVFITLYGIMVLWGGLMKIAEKAGVTAFIGRLMFPVLHLLFPNLKKNGEEFGAISMNITANLFGLGNAATPLGIDAMRKLQVINDDKNTANDEMIVFVVMNSASMKLIPTTVAMLRANHGSRNPMETLLPGLVSSACALTVGLIAAKLYGKFRRRSRI